MSATLQPWVVKFGGALCDERDSIARLSQACAGHAGPLVVVHGGGGEVSRTQAALSLVPRFAAGRRVTSAADLRVVETVLSGLANKSLVRALQAARRPALGLSGCDAGLLQCARVPDLGHVGRPIWADVRILELALGAGYTPVVSPVSLGPEREPLNVNADEAAAALAAALRAPRLLLLSDVQGVQVDATCSAQIDADAIDALITTGHVTGGMIPKLRAAAWAAAHGVGEVRIGGFAGGALADVCGTRVAACPRIPALGWTAAHTRKRCRARSPSTWRNET